MKWIYGKQDWKTMERGQENCFLMTNYLGGFSSMTITGSVTRCDHALLMACTQAPNHRYNMVHRLAERVEAGNKTYPISSQEFADGRRENGYRFLSSFIYEDTPVWIFQINGLEIRKEMGMKRGANTVGIRYEIKNRGKEEAKLILKPFFQFAPKGIDPEENQAYEAAWEDALFNGQKIQRGNVRSKGLKLHFRTNGETAAIPEEKETYFYPYDQCNGRRESGNGVANHEICCTVKPCSCEELELVYEMEESQDTAQEVIQGQKQYRQELIDRAGLQSEMAKTLVKSADQFIARRESAKGDTILAGFPFFEDWGRDTMIALPGLCISTGQLESAARILRTFAVNERDGLMPNLFPEGGNEPLYNTADAALLFINCVYLYEQASGKESFVREMYPVMERIVRKYKKGTKFGIRMDEDGLMMAGEGLSQVTWMDVRVGEILPTPRHGKPVEINAYWYNALRIMEEFAPAAGKDGADYGRLAEQVKASFEKSFWMEKKGYLRDVVSGTEADEQMRCNQIWAVSMPFTMLDREKEIRIVDAVYEKLYTPYGLRTLAMDDPQFHSHYGGPVFERDMAYHQGTVWTFPLGGYYLAYLKVHNYSEEAQNTVKEQLLVMESALREGCVGQLPEIYDGENPTSSRGCFAQAWSVGEILRVYEALEKAQKK